MTPRRTIDLLAPHVVPRRLSRIESVVERRMAGVAVVLEALYDEGNRSAVYRTAEAHGFHRVHVVRPEAATKPHARAVSRGSEKWLELTEHGDAAACVMALRAQGYRVAASDLQSARPLHLLDFSRPLALVFGSEHSGISPQMRELADETFVIPMRGFIESFNISVAAAITLAHARRRREQALGATTDLSPAERESLLATYLRRSVGSAERILAEAGEG